MHTFYPRFYEKFSPPPPAQRLGILAGPVLMICLGLSACEQRALVPQDPYGVSLEQAQQVAEHLSNTNVAPTTAKLKTVSGHFVLNVGQQPALYVFNYREGGFSIIPADRHLLPVLAYSTTSGYANTNKPGGLLLWEQKMALTVVDAKAATTPAANDIIRREWQAALNPNDLHRQSLSAEGNATGQPTVSPNRLAPPVVPPPPYTQTVIGPYLPVTWGQGCTYNELFPAGAYCNTHTPSGCVMTAVAQVMAYYRYPTTYNWAAMPTDRGDAEVQRLMRDISLSLARVVYTPTSTGAYPSEAAGGSVLGGTMGFRNPRFGYRYSTFANYDFNTVVSELQTSRLVILSGYNGSDGSDGHCWVADGVQTDCYNFDPPTNGQAGVCYQSLHMNWGWHEVGSTVGYGGDYAGWFSANNWNIQGANLNFQYSKGMIVNIRP